MALKSTIFKAGLNVVDTDRNVYGDFPLTVARHPSETEQRMMLRILVFALHADEHLAFGRGISTEDEPDLWQQDLAGNIELWIELGTPDPDRLRKACGRARQVLLYTYGDRAAPVWWQKHHEALARFTNLTIYQVTDADCNALARMAAPGMSLHCMISEGEAWLSDGTHECTVKPVQLQPA
jgi:uncharacterized protein YaeQ